MHKSSELKFHFSLSYAAFAWRRFFANIFITGFLGAAFVTSVLASSVTNSTPEVFSADLQTLLANKAALENKNSKLRPALNRLLQDANKILQQKTHSVMEKSQFPPSGDKHDYISQAPYYWRDTNSPQGKYINHDGKKNPEADTNSDAGNFASVCYDSHTLALAYYFSGNEKYANKATELIRVWFLSPATRMNPNLKYGQGIPGVVEGRAAGLISARCLADLVDAVGLLAESKSWTTNDQQRMLAWANDYFKWLTTSKIGLTENTGSNNHGTFYDVQCVSLALFLGNIHFAREKLLAARETRIARQIQPDGKMPRELSRTLSFHYTMFNLSAEMQLANLGKAAGVDLWHYQTSDGRSILRSAEFIAQFADPKRTWPYEQIQKPNIHELGELLLRIAAEYPDTKIKDALKYFRNDDFSDDTERLYLKMAWLPNRKHGNS